MQSPPQRPPKMKSSNKLKIILSAFQARHRIFSGSPNYPSQERTAWSLRGNSDLMDVYSSDVDFCGFEEIKNYEVIRGRIKNQRFAHFLRLKEFEELEYSRHIYMVSLDKDRDN